jgi:threonylcarbamoyladenosine tRNA methylthiotransferase MtaB
MTQVHLRMVGCRLNQAEIDTMARDFEARGYGITDQPEGAALHVVNTCAVTQQATASSRKLIRELHRANPQAAITVTGCYAQVSPDDLRALPGVASVIDNQGKDTLVDYLAGEAPTVFDREPVAREQRLTRTRAFIKVQDGCENACTFCITTVARGAGRSRTVAEVVAEIQQLQQAGCQEAVLTGVHLGSTGHDLGDFNGLETLVRAILSDTDIPRLRLSSLEPWDLAPDFFRLWENPRLCGHLHLPLQSGSDRTLRRMLRRTSQESFRALVDAARTIAPDAAITTDMIAGFPGETDADFEDSLAFAQDMNFAGMHVFPYSARQGTAAARMKGHVRSEIRKERAARLSAVAQAGAEAFAGRFMGQTRPVLWENIAGANDDGFLNVGYTDNYVRVGCTHPRPLTGMITATRLETADSNRAQLLGIPVLEEMDQHDGNHA